MVYSPTHDDMDFTVPLFDAHMRRVMAAFPACGFSKYQIGQ